MQPKRSKLFPIGNTVSKVDDGRLKEIIQPSPQTLHHFTSFDQVDQLVGASEADPDLGLHGAAAGVVQPAPHQSRQP